MNIDQYLKGGDLRSIGKVNELVKLVHNQEVFDKVFRYFCHKDRLKVMRAADAIEMITLRHPEYLQPHNEKLLGLAKAAKNKELKWHLAQLLPVIRWKEEQLAGV